MSEITKFKSLHDRANAFSKLFANANYEMGQAQNFMRGLCDIYGISPYRAAIFEDRVAKNGGGINRLDGLFPGLLLVEMKSKGKSLEKAYEQTKGYVEKLKKRPDASPRYVLVSDFQNLVLYDQESNTPDKPIADFKLADFQQNVEVLGFLSGFERAAILQQETANIAAAKKLGELHDAIKETGYTGDDLERLLVRILFCLFGDDTNLFGESDLFFEIISQTRADGHDLDCALNKCFGVLDMPFDSRPKSLYPEFQVLPYVNGALFKGRLADHCFSSDARTALLECCKIDWSEISPAIFGTLFQAIMHHEDEKATDKPKKRREFGAHYTSEENILKVISPLFLDTLKAELKKAHGDKKKLNAFHAKLRQLEFFDPACGCGNFLVIAYREIRLLEADTLQQLEEITRQQREPICDVDQFYGIEIDSTSAQIAVVAMWITDHQMNRQISNNGKPYLRLPLNHRANIVCANALQIDWQNVIKPKECSFIMGNPPFVGRQYQHEEQKKDLALVFQDVNGAGVLDYVAAWHVKAAQYIQENKKIPVAFVSTNSITQGEQVAVLWTELLKLKVKLHFAHRTFRWNNEGGGVAAVHCVIMGFGLQEPTSYRLFDYGDDIKGEPSEIKVTQINPYLIDAPTILIDKRRKPLSSNAPEMAFGNMPNDGGHLLLSQEEADEIRKNDKIAAKYIRPFLGAEEFINDLPRFCLWLKDSTEIERKKSPEIKKRVEAIKKMRSESSREATQKLAESPYLFGEIRQTDQPYLLIPRVSSEQRKFVPIGYFESSVICGDANFMLPNASLYEFGLLCSTFHNAWMRTVCGRLKSDYRYSNTIVYNNFPFPADVKPAAKKKIEDAAQTVLDARAVHKDKSLADFYNSKTMPENLANAYVELDKAVDAAYSYGRSKKDDASRVAFLFEKYQELIASVDAVKVKK
jgi:hypothetical protein